MTALCILMCFLLKRFISINQGEQGSNNDRQIFFNSIEEKIVSLHLQCTPIQNQGLGVLYKIRTVLGISSYCTGHILVLYWAYPRTVLGISSYCTGHILVLYQAYPRTVLGLLAPQDFKSTTFKKYFFRIRLVCSVRDGNR